MDDQHFDRLTRRFVLGGFAAALGLGTARLPDVASAKKRKKKLKFNKFGCVNVGGKCRGRDAVCCSGICQGKKPKQGKKDRSRCVAHDTGTLLAGTSPCQVEQDSCGVGDTFCTTSAGTEGLCLRTTGNAAYCADGTECTPCTKDADCIPLCGPGAACIVCDGSGTDCDTFCGGPGECPIP